MKPDNLTYPLLIKDCSCPSMNCVGFTVLGHVLRLGFEFDIFVHNASITMLLLYVELEAAYDVFNKGCVRDLVTWNAMITGCVRRGCDYSSLTRDLKFKLLLCNYVKYLKEIITYNKSIQRGMHPEIYNSEYFFMF